MGTLEALALIGIGIAMGFIITKGYQLEKSIKEKSKKAKENEKEQEKH